MADDFQEQVQHLETVAEDAEEGEVEETAAATDEEVAVETAQEPAADEENFNDLKDLVENDARLPEDGQPADDLALADELGFADDTQPESQRVDGETKNENETANEITTETGTEIETELVEKSDENLEIENGDESSRQMPVVEEGDEEEAAKDMIASETVDENKLEKDEAETERVDENEVLGEDEPIVGEGEDAGREESALQQTAEFPQGEEEESLVAKMERLSPAAENDEERELDTSVVPTARSNSLASDDEREVERIQEEDQLEGEEAGENPPGEEEMDMPQPNREQLIEKYHQALAERHQLQEQNYQLQHKLSEHFRRKKADDMRHEEIRNMSDQEQRYLKFMASLDELRRQERQSSEDYKVQLDIREAHVAEKKEQVDGERRKLMEFKKQVSLSAINSRSGKPLQPKDIEQFMINENKRETEVEAVRLENIKLKNKLKKKETQLKSKEELAEGLHLIDFEQLKIENQTYNEKIEERNEELLKLRRKITSTVQVLTHLKEKLQFVQGQNHTEKSHLREVEEQVARKRDELSRLKQVRDALRIDNHKMRQNGGLLGNEPLLRDFEDSKDEADQLKERLNYLKMTHSDLSLKLNGVRRKIEDVKYPESAGY